MSSARIRFEVQLSKGASSEDMPEIQAQYSECVPSLEDALENILARRDEAAPKAGLLAGAYSTSFQAHAQDRRNIGRVVYSVHGATITIWAAYPEHDEAYRRARRRYKVIRRR